MRNGLFASMIRWYWDRRRVCCHRGEVPASSSLLLICVRRDGPRPLAKTRIVRTLVVLVARWFIYPTRKTLLTKWNSRPLLATQELGVCILRYSLREVQNKGLHRIYKDPPRYENFSYECLTNIVVRSIPRRVNRDRSILGVRGVYSVWPP